MDTKSQGQGSNGPGGDPLDVDAIVDDIKDLGRGDIGGGPGSGIVVAAESTDVRASEPMGRTSFIERAKSFRKSPTVKRVELPWISPGEFAFVRGMTSAERDDFESSLIERDPKGGDETIVAKNIRAKFLLRVLCGPDGTRLFANHEEDVLSGLDAKTADALYDAGRELSGVTKNDVAEMAKNSARARSDTSSSPLPSRNSAVSPTS
jgi:hypothetical protein